MLEVNVKLLIVYYKNTKSKGKVFPVHAVKAYGRGAV
jgi:hypothetical protein